MQEDLAARRVAIVEKAKDELFAVAMAQFAGAITDRGGDDFYRQQLKVYAGSLAYLNEAAKFYTGVVEVKLLLFSKLIWGSAVLFLD